MPLALTRELTPAIERCQLTHLARRPIDVALAREQHRRYEEALSELGCEVLRLPADGDLPDAVFVEDTAVVLDELAVVARPGATSRRGETRDVAAALAPHRPLRAIEGPGTLDGGDVLRVGRTLYAGLSGRTDAAGVERFRSIVGPLGYEVRPVAVPGCLHLKSAVTALAEDLLLIQPAWVESAAFQGVDLLEVHPDEPSAANALRVGDTLIYPAAFPRTRERIEARGLAVRPVDVSELAKAEGGVTCCCLIVA